LFLDSYKVIDTVSLLTAILVENRRAIETREGSEGGCREVIQQNRSLTSGRQAYLYTERYKMTKKRVTQISCVQVIYL
jgi:hypothetical protein